MSSEIQLVPLKTSGLNYGTKQYCAEQAVTGKEELRRMMYERIAQGNNLAEAEDLARRKMQR